MSYNPNNTNGQATMAASAPVVIASNQSAVATSQLDSNASGALSATDALGGTPTGTGVFINTAPTAGSFFSAAVPGGASGILVSILGTATGTYYFEYSPDSTTGSDGNWITGLFRQSGNNTTILVSATTTNGAYRGDAAEYKMVRVRNIGGTSPTNTIIIRMGNGTGAMFMNAGLPGSPNIVGKVGIDQTTPGTTNLVAISGTVPVSLATNTPVIATGTNTIGAVNIAAAQTLATVTTVGAVTSITNALPTGANVIGKVSIDQTTSGITNAVNIVSRAAGGLTTTTLISAATTNATSVKASAGTVYGLQASNTGAAVAFLKLYNLAVAPTVGTSVAAKTLIIPAGGGIVVNYNDIGIAFGTGIAYSITGLATTADVTAVALAQVVVNIDYV